MKAVCWNGKHNVQVMKVPDPSIVNPQDAIIKITTTAICQETKKGGPRRGAIYHRLR